MKKIRIVFDTNVLISILLTPHSRIEKLLSYCEEHCHLLVSSNTLDELSEKIVSPKLSSYISLDKGHIFLYWYKQKAQLIQTESSINDCTDPKDNMFLELAVDGEADFIVTGDKKHLLPMNPYRGIGIISVNEAIEQLGIEDNVSER